MAECPGSVRSMERCLSAGEASPLRSRGFGSFWALAHDHQQLRDARVLDLLAFFEIDPKFPLPLVKPPNAPSPTTGACHV